jgi:Tfp pilus assembly protein PilN
MAVQFNLLPDIKLEFDRAQRTKRFVYTLSALTSIVVIAIFVVSFLSVNVLQKKLLNDAGNDITTYSKKLKAIPDLEKVLTIQNQLDTLPTLHQSKHISSRFFGYLPQVTPAKVFIGQVTLDLSADTLTINGTSDKLETINAFVDTLKFTTIKVNDSSGEATTPAFTSVVLASAGRSEKGASYSITASIDPSLFDNTQSVSLVVPNQITTRSVTESPDINSLLFNGDTGKPASGQGGQ